ncbi:MAG: helix-turn-helix transcriptional regulator [Hyphomonas sp.]
MHSTTPESVVAETMELAREINRAGHEIGLPYIAATSDISDPMPMTGTDGKPLAETVFRWVDPDLAYWKDRSFVLRAGVIRASRVCGEPFYYRAGQLGSWRRVRALEALNQNFNYESFGVASAIVSPVHLPLGVIGSVVWATGDAVLDVAAVFAEHAARLHILALKFVSAYRDAVLPAAPAEMAEFTRREIQCLKWAAAGKTDAEIATIMGVSAPTIRFHLNNASRKLGVSGRSQTVRLATTLGYIGQGSGG